jgi:hypothetical protein
MRAIMSDKLRKILRDPQGRRELQQALIKLDVMKSTEISVGNDHYKIQFMPAELKAK